MSDTGNQNQSVSSDQELAKVLQGMQQQASQVGGSTDSSLTGSSAKDKPQPPAAPAQPSYGGGMHYEETAKSGANKPAAPAQAQSQAPAISNHAQTPKSTTPQSAPTTPAAGLSSRGANPGLESLKKEALEELRPLVDKLELPPKEKFDTLLLIIRSTDDEELLQAAHEAAKGIEDETQRAEALLDIVKEVDYFASR